MKKRTVIAIIITIITIIATNKYWFVIRPMSVNFDIFGHGACNIEVQLNNKDDDEFINKTVDLKITNHDNNNIYLKFSDYYLINKYKNIKFLNKSYYLNVNEIKEEDIDKLIEFCDITIGLC